MLEGIILEQPLFGGILAVLDRDISSSTLQQQQSECNLLLK